MDVATRMPPVLPPGPPKEDVAMRDGAELLVASEPQPRQEALEAPGDPSSATELGVAEAVSPVAKEQEKPSAKNEAKYANLAMMR